MTEFEFSLLMNTGLPGPANEVQAVQTPFAPADDSPKTPAADAVACFTHEFQVVAKSSEAHGDPLSGNTPGM